MQLAGFALHTVHVALQNASAGLAYNQIMPYMSCAAKRRPASLFNSAANGSQIKGTMFVSHKGCVFIQPAVAKSRQSGHGSNGLPTQPVVQVRKLVYREANSLLATGLTPDYNLVSGNDKMSYLVKFDIAVKNLPKPLPDAAKSTAVSAIFAGLLKTPSASTKLGQSYGTGQNLCIDH